MGDIETVTKIMDAPMLSTCLTCGYMTFAHYIDCPKCKKSRWDRRRQFNP